MTVLEVGPSTVRRLPPGAGAPLDGDMVAVALAGIDETTVLLHERPVTVESLWQQIFSAGIAEQPGPLTITHPSWWPPRWVARVVDVAGSVTADVVAVSRSALIARRHSVGSTTVVELGGDVVAVCTGAAPPRVCDRSVDAVVVAAAAAGGRVLIDAPHGVPGAEEFGCAVRKALLRNGVVATVERIEDAVPPSAEAVCAVPMRRSRFPSQVAAAAVVGLVMCGVGVATTRRSEAGSVVKSDAVGLVEGRVSVRIPAGWTVTRITAGPGSRRVEVDSRVDRFAALHVTQSYAPQQTMEGAAEVLRSALGREPAGVFVDFNPADERAGRAAVTYREVRAGRSIRWSVVVDGATRISIGCQSALGREGAIDAPCDEAIRSAREVGGTQQRP